MKIALISPWPPEASGIADYAALFAAALEGAGARLLPPPELRDGGGIASIEAAARRMLAAKADIVHCELGGGRIRQFLLAHRLLRLCGDVTVTATVHDPERLAWRGWGLGRFERLPRRAQQAAILATDPFSLARERALARSLRLLVTLTRTGAAALERRMGLPAGQVQVIPHGVATIADRPPPKGGPLRLLFFGYLHPGKGIEDLVAAMAECRRRHGDLAGGLTLTIAGGSMPTMLLGRRGDYVGHLRRSVEEHGLGAQVRFATDLADDEIPALMQTHDVVVLPYRESRKISLLGRHIGSSGALSWAIACGRGALVSDARALAEDVAYNNGAVYPQGDIARLAEWFMRLAADRRLCEAWAGAAAALARERIWPATARHFLRLFEEVLRRKEAMRATAGR